LADSLEDAKAAMQFVVAAETVQEANLATDDGKPQVEASSVGVTTQKSQESLSEEQPAVAAPGTPENNPSVTVASPDAKAEVMSEKRRLL